MYLQVSVVVDIIMYLFVDPRNGGFGIGWCWSVTNPSGRNGERNFVGRGKAWTRSGAFRKANRCARREIRRLRRKECRRSLAGHTTIVDKGKQHE